MKINFLLTSIGLLLGILIHSQFLGINSLEASTERDTILSNLEQVHILAQDNQQLTDEIKTLEEHLTSIQEHSNNIVEIQNELELYEKLNGDTAVSGTGVSVTYTIPVDSYWIIDLINELNLAGAEAIAINDIRYNNYSSLLTSYDPEPSIFMNETFPLEIPVTVTAIGSTETLKEYIEQDSGSLKKLGNSLPDFNNIFYVTSHEYVTLPGR